MKQRVKRIIIWFCVVCLVFDMLLPSETVRAASLEGAASESPVIDIEDTVDSKIMAAVTSSSSYHIKGDETWQWPISEWKKINSGCFGEVRQRTNKTTGKKETYRHAGVDIVRTSKPNQPVLAAQKGKVIKVESGCTHEDDGDCNCNGGRGNCVFILTICENGERYLTLYYHLENNIKVKKGDEVKIGERIGTAGNTGRSYGVHLHFQVHLFPKGDKTTEAQMPDVVAKVDEKTGMKKYVIDPLSVPGLSSVKIGVPSNKLAQGEVPACCLEYVEKHNNAIGATNKYTITYNANGGTGAPDSQTKTKGTNLMLSTKRPTRSGYTFKNWNTKADGKGTSYPSGGSYKADASVTLYAQWNLRTYTVVYRANGGSGQPADQLKTHGQTLILSNTAPTRAGYIFTGWNTMPDGTGTSYAAGAAYTGNANLNLYAQWSQQAYTVAFLDGDGNLISEQNVPHGQAATAPEAPEKEGYRFVYWDTDFSIVTSDLKVKAIYEKLPELIITGQPGGQNIIEGESVIFNVQAQGEGLSYQWQICSNGSSDWLNITTVESGYNTDTLTLQAESGMNGAQLRCIITDRAQQQIISVPVILTVRNKSGVYTITYILNGGTNHPDNVSSYYAWESVTLSEPVLEGKAFGGWFTVDGEQVTTISDGNIIVIAKWLDIVNPQRKDGELWVESIPDQAYTGKAIKPQVKVYNGQVLLQEKKDYTISYVNNIKANDASNEKTAPAVVVTGKGNYSGKEKAFFVINTKDITDADLSAADIFLPNNGKVQKPVPVLKWNSITLKKGTDFTVEYPANEEGAYQESGIYTLIVTGKGNYSGSRTISLQITGSNVMRKANVTQIPSQIYTGRAIEPKLTVKYGKVLLEQDTDYTVTYQNNIQSGTATAILTGKGAYIGEKRVNFKITGVSMSKVTVSGLPQSVGYASDAVYDFSYRLETVMDNMTIKLVEGDDFEVSYQNNAKAGTMTIIFTGINGYKGTLKKTVRITPYDIAVDGKKAIKVTDNMEVPYAKGGAKAEPVVTYCGQVLTKGKDYTLQYRNNKELTTNKKGQKQPEVIIAGKGNFKGKVTVNFTIVKQDIGVLSMSAPDRVFQNKAGKFVSIPVIKDLDGRILTSGLDYEGLTYTYAEQTTLDGGRVQSAGTRISAMEILPVGTKVTITATGKGNYYGEINCTYKISAIDINNAKAKVEDQTYTGRAIKPGKGAITLTLGGNVLADSDYEIVSYSNNVKKGTATMVVKGIGEYGGTKRITFKIKARGITWWWR